MSLSEIYKIFLKYPLISTDTRNIKQNSIFFSLKGENFDGNKFADKALESGAVYAVIDKAEYYKNDKFILVDNVLETLQQLALYHRKQLKIPFLGITGSNGKTTTKELLNAVLSQKFKCIATQGNLNNHIGVPLTVLSVTQEHEIAIIEMGANHIGEIAELCEISKPDFGIITNIGRAHLEGFGSIEGIIKTKYALYESVKKSNGLVFVNGDNPLLMDLSKDIKRYLYGSSSDNYCYGESLINNNLVSISYSCKGIGDVINTWLAGDYNKENILAAIVVGYYFNLDKNEIKFAIENYKPSNNRSQIIYKGGNTIIMDAYNANPSSLESALMNFSGLNVKNKVLIIGDMLELGSYSAKEHENILTLIESLGFSDVYLVGKEFVSVCQNKNWKCFDNSSDVINFISNNPINNSNIMIKGSRGIKLETILDVL